MIKKREHISAESHEEKDFEKQKNECTFKP